MTPDELKADYAKALVHASKFTDTKGNKNDPTEVAKVAFNGVRSKLFATLQAENPCPDVAPEDADDPEDVHAHQKKHNKKLWKQVEAAVAAAGITERGTS